MDKNVLYFGDNLDILRRYLKDETVDLVYLDPPFNSNAAYNILYPEQDGSQAAAQIKAFGDTWKWDSAAALAYRESTEEAGGSVSKAMQAFMTFLGKNNLLAYLSMMAPRLVELRRALKPTGSIYLHCDPTASHYLKMLMDAIFGPSNFRTEISWKRSSAHSDAKQGRKQPGNIRDIILFYTKSNNWTWNWDPEFGYTKYDEEYIRKSYRFIEPGTGRRFQPVDLTAAKPGGDTSYEWKGYKLKSGRYWAYSKENMAKFESEGKIYYTKSGLPRLKYYLDEMPGVSIQNNWDDINPAKGKEDLGYSTQKPLALLERIIACSSNSGDLILDPFCGCGTTITAAQSLSRRWIGIDITNLAITLMKHRLLDAFGEGIVKTYDVIGEPTSVPDAEALAKDDPYQFQYWALGLVGARPVPIDQKKGADKGIDGRLWFHEGESDETKQVILSVKGGHTSAPHLRDLRGVVEREKAEIGVLITMQDPTPQMRSEAATGGFYESPWGTHPKLQILTVAELLDGKRIDMPPLHQVNKTFRNIPKDRGKKPQKRSFLDETGKE